MVLSNGHGPRRRKVAFVFPGQGAQEVGMGLEVHGAFAESRRVFETVDRVLEDRLSELCFRGPEQELQLTRNTQPAILATSVALLRAIDRVPDVAAGHSLGEYSAHVCAGTLTLEDAARVVRLRGDVMQSAVAPGEGAMAAVMGIDGARVEELCDPLDGVWIANYNSARQTVISGWAEGVAEAAIVLKGNRAKVVPLPVSAPFHCPLMEPAEERLRGVLREVPFAHPALPVVANVDWAEVTGADRARQTLSAQVSRPVRWLETMHLLMDLGVGLVVEVGPGNVLSKLMRRVDKNLPTVSVQSPPDIEAARQAIEQFRLQS